MQFFREHYRFATLRDNRLSAAIINQVAEILHLPPSGDGLVDTGLIRVRQEHLEPDLDVVRDVYRDDEYKVRPLKLRGRGRKEREEIVFDIGAHIGAFAVLYHEIDPEARIICVEACPENLG